MGIFTHGDFDGIVSAALVMKCLGENRVFFASPKTIAEKQVHENDIVCDLPYPHRKIRYWFDHHEGNIETIQRLGLADDIDGSFVAAPSAAQVVYDFFREENSFPGFIVDTVKWANIIDSMDYPSVEEWLAPTAAHKINKALYLPGEKYPDAMKYMRLLVQTVGRHPLDAIAESDDVEDRFKIADQHEKQSVELIQRGGKLMGPNGEIVVLDFSEDRFAPRFSKNMAYTIFPDAQGILQLTPGFRGGKRMNQIRVSLSLNPFGEPDTQHDAAAILEKLDVGSGHAGAAGGGLQGDNKQQLMSRKQAFLDSALELWLAQAKTEG